MYGGAFGRARQRMVRYSVAPRFRFGNSPWRWNEPPVIADAVGSAARPRLPDSVGCDGFSVRRAFPVRCLSAVIRLAVLGKVGSRLAGTDVGMLPREAVACLDLLPGDRLRRTFGAAVFPDFLVCRVTRGDKAGLRLADDTPERTTVRLSEIGLLLVLDLLPLVVGRVGRYSENYGRIPHGRRIGRRRGGGQSPCDQQRPDVGIASPEIPVQRGSRLAAPRSRMFLR